MDLIEFWLQEGYIIKDWPHVTHNPDYKYTYAQFMTDYEKIHWKRKKTLKTNKR
jgi:hypothetical protein